MLKRQLSLALVVVLVNAVQGLPISVFAQTDQAQLRVEKVKAAVAKRGVGKKARVTVKLNNGSKLKGYISQAEENSFTLTSSKTGETRTLGYQDVREVKKQGGLSLLAKIGIGIAAVVGVLAILYIIECDDDAFC